MAYSPDTMELIGPASGEIKQDYFLCIPFAGFSGGDSLDAITNALKPHAADALLNPAVQTEYFFLFPFYCSKRVTVYGTAVKLKRTPLPAGNRP